MPRHNLLGNCWDVVDINFNDSNSDDEDIYSTDEDVLDESEEIADTFVIHQIYTHLINYTKETGVLLLDDCELSDWLDFVSSFKDNDN